MTDSIYLKVSGNAFDEESSIDGRDMKRDVLLVEEKLHLLPEQSHHVPLEYEVPTRRKLFYLAGYFILNLFLTLYNKAVMQSFKYPWLLTSVHCACTASGCYLISLKYSKKLTSLSWQSNVKLAAFSVLFTANIAMSNVSLAEVSVAFHQIARATCPVFLIAIQRLAYGREYSVKTYLALVPLIAGVVLATIGDYYFTLIGLVLTFLGVFLAATKSVLSNQLMTGPLELPPFELLLRMTPLAAIQSIGYFAATGEGERFLTAWTEGSISLKLGLAVFVNGMMAFAVNLSSFSTNKLAGALTITVAANLKQCLTIVLGTLLFNVHMTILNGVGIAMALIGAAMYSKIELESKLAK